MSINVEFTTPETTASGSFNTTDVIMAITMSIVACFIAFGNTLVVLAIYMVTSLQTPKNMYILFLACSDLAIALSVPYSVAFIINRESWQTSESACLIRFITINHSVYTSMLLLLGKY